MKSQEFHATVTKIYEFDVEAESEEEAAEVAKGVMTQTHINVAPVIKSISYKIQQREIKK